jgi:hypothetical protein
MLLPDMAIAPLAHIFAVLLVPIRRQGVSGPGPDLKLDPKEA